MFAALNEKFGKMLHEKVRYFNVPAQLEIIGWCNNAFNYRYALQL